MLLIIGVACIVVESKRVADFDVFASYVHHAAVGVEHVHDRCAFDVAVLAASRPRMTFDLQVGRLTSDVVGI